MRRFFKSRILIFISAFLIYGFNSNFVLYEEIVNFNLELNGVVRSLKILGGEVYLSGNFTQARSQTRNYLAKINASNGSLSSYHPNFNGPVNDMAISGTDLFAGGDFTQVAGQSRTDLAKISTSTGLINSAFTANTGNGIIGGLNFSSNLYAGGTFTSIGGKPMRYMAQINPSTGAVSDALCFTDKKVNTFLIDQNNLYIGGDFSLVGPHTGAGIKLKNSSCVGFNCISNDVLPLSSFPKVNGVVYTSVEDGSGGFVIGGTFTQIGNTNISYLARISSSGQVDTNFNLNLNNHVSKVIRSGSSLYVAGHFTSIGGQSRNYLAKIDTAGTVDPDFNANANLYVSDIVLDASNYIFAGGDFTQIGGVSRKYLAKLNITDGQSAGSFNLASLEPNSFVGKMTRSGSLLVVAGNFTTIGGQTRNRLAQLNTTSGQASSLFNPNPDNAVYTVASSGNDLYVGGNFITISGESRWNLAKLNMTTGAADPLFNPPPGTFGTVNTVMVTGSDLYVGSAIGLTKHSTTNVAQDMSYLPEPIGIVYTMTFIGTHLYAGGSFTSIGALRRNRLAKINLTTGLPDSAFDIQMTNVFNYTVHSITLSPSDLFVGGHYHVTQNGNQKNNLARFNKNTGEMILGFTPAPNSTVRSVVQSGDDLYIAGDFFQVAGISRGRIAKVNANTGLLDMGFNPNANNIIHSLALNGSYLFAGGEFITIGGKTRNYFARINTSSGQVD